METEVWKNVIGFENLYEVSNLGNVRNYKKQKTTKRKYSKIGISLGNTKKRWGKYMQTCTQISSRSFYRKP